MPTTPFRITPSTAIELNDTLSAGSYTLAPTTVGEFDNIAYALNSDVYIAEGATLTIAPGVVIKRHELWENANLVVHGTLVAQGTTESPIVFTDIKDDTYGGDTNTDGNASLPQTNYGAGMQLYATSGNSSTLSHCYFRYGGSLLCLDSDPTITNCHFFKNETSLIVTQNGMPTVENNVFEQDVSVPISLSYATNCDLTNNSLVDNAIQAIRLWGIDNPTEPTTYSLFKRKVGEIENVPYLVTNDLDIPTNVWLTLTPGLIIKHSNVSSRMNVSGTLRAEGTADEPIVFTSLRDDQYGGDTNNDGDATCPGLNDWGSLYKHDVESNANLNHCIIRFSANGIRTGANAFQIHNTVFEHNWVGITLIAGCSLQVDSCIFIANKRGIQISNGQLTVQLSQFHNNEVYDIDNQATQAVEAMANWWGTNHTFDMQNLGANQNLPYLYDAHDNPSKGPIHYFPPLPIAPAIHLLGAAFDFDRSDNEVYFYNTAAQSDTTVFTWDFGDGSPTDTHLNPSHHYDYGGNYEVCLSNSTIIDCNNNNQYCQVVSIPGVSQLLPAQAGSTSLYMGYLYGVFEPDATAQILFTQGSTTLTADTLIYLSDNQIQVYFNLVGAPTGSYDVEYVSASVNGTLPGALTIAPTTPYGFEVLVEGPASILPNSFYDYTMQVNNWSNQTAFGVPVYITISGDTEAQLVSAAVTDHLPTAFANLNSHFFKIFNETTQDSVWLGAFTVLSIPPGSAEFIDFKIKTFSTTPFKVQTYVGQPFYPAQLIANNIENGNPSTDCGAVVYLPILYLGRDGNRSDCRLRNGGI